MIRETLAVSSWFLVAAFSLVPERSAPRASTADVVLTAAVFFGAAALTRFWLQETRSRWQIVAFVAAATVLALLRLVVPGRSLSMAEVALAAGSAIAGVLVVRTALEGLPF